MKVCSLFSGGGLGDYGLELAGMEVIFQCEIDDYCQKILNLRWPNVKRHKDIKTLEASDIPECDIITGGFPCQPFSVAGKRRGKEDDRHLWPEMFRIIKQVKPTWVLGENVPGIIKYGIDEVLHDLEAEDYATLPIVFPAHAVGANHKRDRVWIVANADGKKGSSVHYRQEQGKTCKQKQGKFGRSGSGIYSSQWTIEPAVGRVAHGTPNRVDRLKLLGNGQVVQAVQWIGERIIRAERIGKVI